MRSPNNARRPHRWLSSLPARVAVLVMLAAACGSGSDEPEARPDMVVELPGAERPSDFDDLTYAPRLGRVLVPALDAGLYLIEPNTGEVTRFDNVGAVHSATEGDGTLLVADRDTSTIAAVDPASGRTIATAETRATPDYVRYVAATDEVWVTEPGEHGIEIFELTTGDAPTLRSAGFVTVPAGPEGLTTDDERRAYTHTSDGNVAVIDVDRREVVDRWRTGCDKIHGIPAVDDERGVLLAGCGDDGEGVLVDVDDDGKRLDTHAVGGGEALMAHGTDGHFYLRGDPGSTIATLVVTDDDALEVIAKASAPDDGHCLLADTLGHYWTCDEDAAAILRYTTA
jgi:outer membrane protein assembly factor BamB